MSERTIRELINMGCLLLGAVLGFMGGALAMAKWQDRYYAAHPVVKETAVKDDGTLIIYGDNLPNSCEQKVGHMECSYKIACRDTKTGKILKGNDCLLPAPAPPVKPAKATIWTPKPNVIYCGDRPCSEFSAKPAKGNKRQRTEYERGYEAAFRDLQTHSALTLPEKEPQVTPGQWLQEHPPITCTVSIPPICEDAPAVKPQ